MLSLTIGLLLLIGGVSGRVALLGSRANVVLAAAGTVLSLAGLGRLFRQRISRPLTTDCEPVGS